MIQSRHLAFWLLTFFLLAALLVGAIASVAQILLALALIHWLI